MTVSKTKKSTKKHRQTAFARPRQTSSLTVALAFVLAFILIGTYVVYRSYADSTPVASASDPSQTDSSAVDGSEAATTASCAAQSFKAVTAPDGATLWLNPDRYGGGTMCPSNSDGKTDFTVVSGGTPKAADGDVQAFPDLVYGCTSSKCIPGSGLPKRASALVDPRGTVSLTATASDEWDAVYDIWFNKANAVGPPTGAEVLIMLNEKNKGFPTGVAKSKETIDGTSWWMLHYNQSSDGHTWHFVEFRRVTSVNTASGLAFVPFIKQAESIGQLSSGWYMTGIDTGFEIWSGGLGLHMQGVTIAGL